MAIEIQGEMYDFKFTPLRVERIEKVMGKSMVNAFYQEGGMLPLADIKTIFVNGLKKEDGGYILPKTGEDVFYRIMDEIGYAPLIGMIEEALERDCPFFFREA